MKKLDFIFVDFDGPILDGKLRHYNCYKDIIVKDGGIPIDINIYWSMKRNKIKRDVLLTLSNYQGTYDDFYKQWLNNIEEKKYLSFDILKPNVKSTLYSWRKIAKSIVLVTMRNNRCNLLWQLDSLGLSGLFDQIISCPNTGQNYVKYQALRNICYETAVFIGDTEEDINTAKKMSIYSIAITNGLREKLYLDADCYVEEIYQIDFSNIVY